MGNKFSDAKKSSNISRRRLYSDISMLFKPHPNTQDMTAVTDIDAVKQSIKNLVLTRLTERPFQPLLGTGLAGLLFELADQFTEFAIRDEIFRVITEYEPRVTNLEVGD